MSKDAIRFEGNIGRFSAVKASEDGTSKLLSGKFCIPEPELSTLADLCENPQEAAKAFRAARNAGAKIEIPTRRDEYILRYFKCDGKKPAEVNEHGKLKKIVYNGTKSEPIAELYYSEPLLLAIANFMLERLGADIALEVELKQMELPLE